MLSQKLLARLCRARAALRDLECDVTVASAAKASRLSRSQFILRYRTAFGETPHQTRMRARLDQAKWLLATSDLLVTEICMTIGLSSVGSFSQLFRSRFGESPAHYRARLANAAAGRCRASGLAPHCLSLLGAAWTQPSYFSRSAPRREQLEFPA